MHHTIVFTFLFFNQCGLSRTDVNNHSTHVCVCLRGGSCSYEAKAEGFDFCAPRREGF